MLRKGEAPGLVALPHDNLVMRHITTSLRRAGVAWEPTLEVSSMGHVPVYVDLDFGFGFGFAVTGSPSQQKPGAAIGLPADKVPPLHLVAWHADSPNDQAIGLLGIIREQVAALLG